MKKFLFILVLVYLCSCQSGKISTQEYAKAFISMERTACYGKCPVYKITIYGTGKAVYKGGDNVKKKGSYEKELSKKEISSLFTAFEQASFFDFNTEYTGNITDLPYTYLTYQNKNEIKKTITDYYKAPDELKKLEKLVDDVVNSGGWEAKK